MPEILRNLTIAEILWHLGILIWLGRFRLAFCKGICNNIATSEKGLKKILSEDQSDLALERGPFLLLLNFRR